MNECASTLTLEIVHMLPRTQSSKRRRGGKPNVVQRAPAGRRDVASTPRYILVVDDNEDARDVYASYLSYAGYRVAQAENGEEALSKVHHLKPDLIVMDLAMPRLDGWEATRLIKSNPRTSGIRILVLTGQVTDDDERRARAAGADEFYAKPLLPHEMLEVVRAMLGDD